MNLTPLILRHVFWLGWGGGDYVPAMDSTNHQNCVSNFLSNWQRRFYSQIRCIALRICKLRTGFSVPSIILVGGCINYNATHSPSLARKNKTENNSRLVKNRKSRWRVEFLTRAGGRHCFILARVKNKKDQKNLRRKLVNYSPKQGTYKQRIKRTMKHRNKQTESKCTNHK